MPYSKKNLEIGLQELAAQLERGDISKISFDIRRDADTVSKYLKGDVSHSDIGKAILLSGRKLIMSRQVA